MCAGKAIHALCQGHQPQKNKPQKSASQCPNCTCAHPPGHDNCPVWNTIYKGCSKKGHWHAKFCSSGTASQQPTKSNGAEKAPHCWHHEKGKKADMVQVNTEEASPCSKLFINAVDCRTVGNTHPEEIAVDDACAPWCNEAYTMVQLPASTSSKGTASLCIKADTGDGGQCVAPLCFPISLPKLDQPRWPAH